MLVSNKCSATGPVNRTIHIDKSQKEKNTCDGKFCTKRGKNYEERLLKYFKRLLHIVDKIQDGCMSLQFIVGEYKILMMANFIPSNSSYCYFSILHRDEEKKGSLLTVRFISYSSTTGFSSRFIAPNCSF